jgi:hypothetical protein
VRSSATALKSWLRSWVQIPPSPFYQSVKYGIEVNLFYEVAGQKQYLEVGLEAQLKLQLEQVEPPSDKQVIYE